MNLPYSRALIVRKEYLDLILDNGKVWEMRSRKTNVRGRIGLIEAGSGLIVGETEIVDCHLNPLHKDIATQFYYRHRIADPAILENWGIAWVLKNSKRYDNPIPYKHPQGAVVWVRV